MHAFYPHRRTPPVRETLWQPTGPAVTSDDGRFTIIPVTHWDALQGLDTAWAIYINAPHPFPLSQCSTPQHRHNGNPPVCSRGSYEEARAFVFNVLARQIQASKD